MKKIILPLCIALGLSGCGSGLKRVGGQGQDGFYTVESQHVKDKNYILDAINEVCKGQDYCSIAIWEAGKAKPISYPLTRHELEIQLVDYKKNLRTNKSRLLWNCKFYPDTPPDRCFTS